MISVPVNPNGQASNNNSSPVTLSTEQQALLESIKSKTDNLDVALSTRTKPSDTQSVSASSLPLPTGAASETTLSSIDTKIPTLGEKSSALSVPVTLSTENITDLSIDGQASQTAQINNIIPAIASSEATDVSEYRSFSIQVVSTGTGGTFIFEGSNNNSNFVPVAVYNTSLVVRIPIITAITATNSNIIYEGSCNFKYIRLRIATTITGGSIRAFSLFIQTSLGTSSQIVSNGTAANLLTTATATQSGTWTMQMGNTPNTTPILANPLTPTVSLTGDTGAKIATGNGATQTNVNAKGALIVLNLGVVSGGTPTLVLKIQGSANGGTTWLDIPNAFTASISLTGTYGINIYPGLTPVSGVATEGTMTAVSACLPRNWRVVWTIGGSSPSFTITNIQVSYLF